MPPRKCFLIFFTIVSLVGATASAQLRIVDYNTANSSVLPRSEMNIVLEAIGDESVNGIAKPIDVLVLQEQASVNTTTQRMADILNDIYGNHNGNYTDDTTIYAASSTNAATTGAGRVGLVYNTESVLLIGETPIGSASTGGAARQPMRYRLRPIGYDSGADFYIYNSHYKAGTSSSDQNRRDIEATAIRNNADTIGDGTNIIYAGDYNIRSNLEAMWAKLTASGNGQAIDPLNPSNSVQIWNNSSGFTAYHTQSPHDGTDPSLITGGVDDRFDFQLVTAEMLDGEGLALIGNSYHVFGNNGTHGLNNPINSVNNTAATSDILDALAHVSDHLPVVADYQLPAVANVSVSSLPSKVIIGATATADVIVTNAANVVAANGADELDYVVTGSGGLLGSDSDSDAALGGGTLHAMPLDTTTSGAKYALATVNTTSEAAANDGATDFQFYNVLDHAEASFSASTNLDTLTLDLGSVHVGATSVTDSFEIYNLEQLAGYTAKLDLDSFNITGDTAQLTSTDLTTFSSLEAGDAHSFTAMLGTAGIGTFNTTITLTVSDEDLSGATTGTALVLELVGEVYATLIGDADLDNDVDADDFNLLAFNFGQFGNWAEGDFDGNGNIDADDFNLLAFHFGSGAASDAITDADHAALVAFAAVIPEPTSAIVLGTFTGLMLMRRRQV